MADSIVIEIPIRIVSVANLSENWPAKSKRTKRHRNAAILIPKNDYLPCVVTLTRIAPRVLDDDNLRSAFKALRDGIADRLGIKDNDPRCKWQYDQRKIRPGYYSAIVEISPMRMS